MTSTGLLAGVNPLDDKNHLKAFFAYSRANPFKNYRSETVETSEVEPEITYDADPENASSGESKDALNGDTEDAAKISKVASPALTAASANEVEEDGGSIGEYPAVAALNTNGTKKADSISLNHGSELWKFDSLRTFDNPSASPPPSHTGSEKDAFDAYGLSDGPVKPDTLTDQDAHMPSFLNVDFDERLSQNGNAEIYNATLSPKTILSPKAKEFSPAQKFNPKADLFESRNTSAGIGDLDSPAARNKFFRVAKPNATSSAYTPGYFREREGLAAIGPVSSEEASLKTYASSPSYAKMTESSSYPIDGEQGTSDKHRASGMLSNKFLESPYLSGVQAPPPTPESVSQSKHTIHVPDTISEQEPEPLDENYQSFSLSQSMHAPPHVRSTFKVQKKAVSPEKNATFERLSFKTASDDAVTNDLNGAGPTNGVAAKTGDRSQDNAVVAKLPPRMRDRPVQINSSQIAVSKEKTGLDMPAPVKDSLGSDLKKSDAIVPGTAHAYVCPTIDIQRLMDLGIYKASLQEYKPSLQENMPPKKTLIANDQERTHVTPAAYVPPHKRGRSTTSKVLRSFGGKKEETLDTVKPIKVEGKTSGFVKMNGAETSKAVEPAKLKGSGLQESAVKTNGTGKEDKFTEDTVFFARFPTPPPRSAGPARHRKVILKGLPEYSTAAFASGLVWGGPLEDIVLNATGTYAYVVFMYAKDCETFYNATSNDIEVTHNGKSYFVVVQKDSDVTPESGQLKVAIEREYTRSVRLVGVEKTYSLGDIWALAAMKNRKVESVEDGKSASGARQIVVTFCNVHDAVKFKSDLNRDDEWEPINIHFNSDPCAEAKGVRNVTPSATYLVKRPVASAF